MIIRNKVLAPRRGNELIAHGIAMGWELATPSGCCRVYADNHFIIYMILRNGRLARTPACWPSPIAMPPFRQKRIFFEHGKRGRNGEFREFYVQKSLFLLRENRIFSTVRTFGREYQILGKEDSRTINRQSGTSKNEDVFTFQLQTTKICVHIFYWNNWNNWNNHAFTQYTAYQSNIHSDMPHHFNYFNYFN